MTRSMRNGFTSMATEALGQRIEILTDLREDVAPAWPARRGGRLLVAHVLHPSSILRRAR